MNLTLLKRNDAVGLLCEAITRKFVSFTEESMLDDSSRLMHLSSASHGSCGLKTSHSESWAGLICRAEKASENSCRQQRAYRSRRRMRDSLSSGAARWRIFCGRTLKSSVCKRKRFLL